MAELTDSKQPRAKELANSANRALRAQKMVPGVVYRGGRSLQM